MYKLLVSKSILFIFPDFDCLKTNVKKELNYCKQLIKNRLSIEIHTIFNYSSAKKILSPQAAQSVRIAKLKNCISAHKLPKFRSDFFLPISFEPVPEPTRHGNGATILFFFRLTESRENEQRAKRLRKSHFWRVLFNLPAIRTQAPAGSPGLSGRL